MSLLKDLVLKEQSSDLSRLPVDDMRAIQSNIRKGAEDLDQNWANALELVHKAYSIEGIERPRPDMKSAWEQYEENLSYAVQQLAKNRGMDADWRMSSSIFHEAKQQANATKQYKVTVITPEETSEYVTEASNVTDVVNRLEYSKQYDVITETTDNGTKVNFARFGVHKKIKVLITQL